MKNKIGYLLICILIFFLFYAISDGLFTLIGDLKTAYNENDYFKLFDKLLGVLIIFYFVRRDRLDKKEKS